MSLRHLASILLALAAGPLAAQEPEAGPPAQRCDAAAHRQFDFWLGEWTVRAPDGAEQGTNRITRVADGCGLLEEWRGSSGTSGVSINYFDPGTGRWRQHWVGGGGVLLHLTGGLDARDMVLSGDRETPQGAVRDRIRWTPEPGGAVRQTWELSRDGGATWETVFIGVYTRARRGDAAR